MFSALSYISPFLLSKLGECQAPKRELWKKVKIPSTFICVETSLFNYMPDVKGVLALVPIVISKLASIHIMIYMKKK